jgi:Fe-S cluster biosynthesis and repair protein YggX
MARYEKTLMVVECTRLGAELPAMEKPPFPGELGDRIFENVSQLAYQQWQQQATIVINHYGLNMADPRAHEFLFQQMEEFFFGGGGQLPADWTPEGQGGTPQKK